jgi:hypothetical protein
MIVRALKMFSWFHFTQASDDRSACILTVTFNHSQVL